MRNNCCPICKTPLDKDNSYPLKNAKVCMDCVEKLRFLYPIEYWKNQNYKLREEPDLSAFVLSDDCTSADAVQAIEEFRRKRSKKSKGIEFYTIDRMYLMTKEIFIYVMEHREWYRDQMKAQHEDYDNIFVVEKVEENPKLPIRTGIQSALKYRGSVCAVGYIRLGQFHNKETVYLLGSNEEIEADIMYLDRSRPCMPGLEDGRGISAEDLSRDNSYRTMYECSYAAMVFSGETARWLKPGDILVTDD